MPENANLARAKEIAACRDSLERELQDIAGCNDGELKIAVPVIRGSHILPSVFPSFASCIHMSGLRLTKVTPNLWKNSYWMEILILPLYIFP